MRIKSVILDYGTYCTLHLTRPQLLSEALDAMDLYERDSECLHPLRVIFVDRSGQNEAAIDNGGPSREFGCRFAQQLRASDDYMDGKFSYVVCVRI